MKRWLATLLMSSLIVVRTTVPGASDQAEPGKVETMTKVSADLARLYDDYTSRGAGALEPVNPLLRVTGDSVTIDAVASNDVNTLKSDLQALGMQHTVAFGRIVSGQLPIRSIGALDALASLKFARPAYAATHQGTLNPGSSPPPVATPPAKTQEVR